MTWDKLWAINKKVIDPVAPRHVALDKRGLVRVVIEGTKLEAKPYSLHPKNADVGTKQVYLPSTGFNVHNFLLVKGHVRSLHFH